MERIRQEIRAGNTLLIKEYDLFTPSQIRQRAPKSTLSPMSKVRANYRAALWKLTAILNGNGHPGDWHIVFTYRPENRPESGDAWKKFNRRVLDPLRKRFAGEGKRFWYIGNTEIGKRGAVHHHLVIPYCDPLLIRSLWGDWGGVYFTPLDTTGEYSRLAAYLIKQYNPDKADYNPQPGRKWHMSQGLSDKLRVKKKTLHGSFETKDLYCPKGYMINPDSVYIGCNPYTGRAYRSYILFQPYNGKGVKP